MSDGGIQEVGARLVLTGAAAFQAQLQKSADALKEFNDEQERAAKLAKGTSKTVATSAATQADAVTAAADKQSTANAKVAASQDAVAASSTAASDKVVAGSAAAAAAQKKAAAASAVAHKKATEALSDFSSKILMYGGAFGLFAGYEGVKKYLGFNQQITQLGINAGVSAKSLGAFSAAALKVSDATGLAATSVGDIFYRIASTNPKIKATTASLVAMGQQAANLAVMTGNPTGTYDQVARIYGAVVSNQLSVNGGKPLGYSTASGAAINAWANAVTGKGDVKMGDLVESLGTGILPVAKTFGLNLNQVGGMLDVLFPAMNASSASTRLKTAISMLGAPSPTATQAYELFGANATTPGALLRSKGPVAMLNYLHSMLTGRVTGATFSNAFYGAGLGSITGGTKGVGTGAGEYLRVAGFTPGQIGVMEGPGGIASFAKMSPAQLAAIGMKGTTGAVAEKTIQASLVSKMFGGGHTGAAVMQLLNERGVLAGKIGSLSAAEAPATYNAALKLAFNEPKVQLAMFGQAISNLTIEIGQGLTPVVTSFAHDLLGVGNWFGKNKWAVEALGIGAAAVYGGAAVVKTVSVVAKVVGGVKTVFGAITGTSSLTGSLAANTAAVEANTIALGGGDVKSLLPTASTSMLGPAALGITTAAVAGYGAHKGFQLLNGVWTRSIPVPGHPKQRETIPYLYGPMTPASFGKDLGNWWDNVFDPKSKTKYPSGTIAGLPGSPLPMFGTAGDPFSAQARSVSRTMGVSFGVAGTFDASMARAAGMKTASGQDRAAFNASAQLVAAGVKQLDASDHMKMTASQLSEAYKSEAAALEKFITGATDQTTAADQTKSAATNLATVTKELASAAVNLNNAAANAAAAHTPGNLFGATNSALKTVIARK